MSHHTPTQAQAAFAAAFEILAQAHVQFPTLRVHVEIHYDGSGAMVFENLPHFPDDEQRTILDWFRQQVYSDRIHQHPLTSAWSIRSCCGFVTAARERGILKPDDAGPKDENDHAAVASTGATPQPAQIGQTTPMDDAMKTILKRVEDVEEQSETLRMRVRHIFERQDVLSEMLGKQGAEISELRVRAERVKLEGIELHLHHRTKPEPKRKQLVTCEDCLIRKPQPDPSCKICHGAGKYYAEVE